MIKMTLFEQEEYGKEYIVVSINLNNLDDNIPGFIRTALENVKLYQKFVKVIKIDDKKNTEIEYFENSVRSNKKGPAFIDRNGKKYFYDMGKEMKDPEKLINIERSQTLREFLDETLDGTELPRSGLD